MRLGTNTVFAATLFGLVLISVSLVGATSMWASKLGFQATATTGDPGIEVTDADGYVVISFCCPCCGHICKSKSIDSVWVEEDGGSAGARVYLKIHKSVIWVGAVVKSNGTVPVMITGFDVYASADHHFSTSTEVYVYGPFTDASDSNSWRINSGCDLPISNQSALPMKLWPGEEAVVWVKITLYHRSQNSGTHADAEGLGEIEPDCRCPLGIRVDVSITPVIEGSQ